MAEHRRKTKEKRHVIASSSTKPSARTNHLAARDVAALRDVLTEELEAQHRQVLELQSTVDDLTGQADSDSVLERELAERSRHRALEVIGEIQDAIRRIESAEYGTCHRCGGAIALERLRAIPFTRHCVDCPPPAPPLIG